MTTTTTAKQRAWSPAHPGFYLNVFSIVAAVGIAIVMTASRRWTGVGAAAAGGIAGFMVADSSVSCSGSRDTRLQRLSATQLRPKS